MIRSLTHAWSSARGGMTVKGLDGGASATAAVAAEEARRCEVEGGDSTATAAFAADFDPFLDEDGTTLNARIN